MLVHAMRRAPAVEPEPAKPEPADVPTAEPFQVPDSFWTDEDAVGGAGAIPSGTPSGVPLRGNGLPLSYSYSYDAYPQPPLPSPPPPPHAPPPPPPTQITLCANGCPAKPKYANDNYCDDGGPDSLFDNCELGTDCADCGPRVRYARVPLAPRPPPPPAPPPPVRFVGTSRASATNPFVGAAAFYRRTAYRRLVGAVLEDDTVPQSARAALLSAWRAPTAFWVDASERVGPAADGTETAASVLADAAAQGGETPPLVVFVLHALPNRGCDDDAPASRSAASIAPTAAATSPPRATARSASRSTSTATSSRSPRSSPRTRACPPSSCSSPPRSRRSRRRRPAAPLRRRARRTSAASARRSTG